MSILFLIVVLSLILWIILFFFRGGFWRADQIIETDIGNLSNWPSVAIIIPARNEEKYIATALESLISQKYPGNFKITVVNDNSNDNTLEAVKKIKDQSIAVLNGSSLPKGWTGKLWALKQGIELSNNKNPSSDYYLLTDADILHSPETMKTLITKAERENL